MDTPQQPPTEDKKDTKPENNKTDEKISSSPTPEHMSSVMEKGTENHNTNKKQRISAKRWVMAVGLVVGAIILFVFGVIVFQPNAYLSLLKGEFTPSKITTATKVVIERQVESSSEGEQPFSDSISIDTNTEYIAPDTWGFKTKIKSPDFAQAEGIDVKIFGENEAYQRQIDSDTAYTKYDFMENEYDTTIEAIEGSSFFQPGLLEYMQNPRFVWKSEGQPWWQPHYRFDIAVGNIEHDKPDWYVSELYPFASEPALGPQEVTFTMDVWVNPFTGNVTHEFWTITKKTTGDEQYTITLDITLDRSYSYPSDLTIEKPS